MTVPPLPPDAAARDAAKHSDSSAEPIVRSDDFHVRTRGVTEEERAAVIAVLTRARIEERERRTRIERQERQPWARSQRVPEGIADLLVDP